MRMRTLLIALLACTLPCLAAVAGAQPPAGNEDIAGLGYIDWVNQRAVASGYGVPKSTSQTAAQANISARRAAVVDARRNLLEVVKKVRIDSATRVENLMAVSDAVTSRVQGIVQYSQIVGEQRKPDGSFVVAVSVPLVGELAGELLASGAGPAAMSPAVDAGLTGRVDRLERRVAELEAQLAALARALRVRSDDRQAADAALRDITARLDALESPPAPEAAPAAAPASAPYTGPYTGLVVDARGTGFKPCLRPRILSAEGDPAQATLYPGPAVDEAVAVSQGYVRYYRDLAQAQQSAVAGDTPRTVKAQPATSGGDIVVSDKDADLLRRAMTPGSFLSACRVVVVF